MKQKFPLYYLLFLTVAVSACTKIVSTEIGGGLLPPIDGVNTKEMFLDVISKNGKDTTTRIGTSGINVLGHTDDPLFGRTDATINVELKPQVYPFILPAASQNPVIDSVVLVLGYAGAWGDTTQNIGLRVYEVENPFPDPLQDTLKASITYASDYDVTAGRELTYNGMAASINIRSLSDTVHPYGEDSATVNQVRIRLMDSYGDELLKNYDTSVNGAYHGDSLFERFFHGYKIKPEQFGNALLKINLLDTNTKLSIYYRYDDATTAGKRDTAVRYFKVNSLTSGSSDYVVHDRSGTELGNHYLPTNSDVNDSLIFVDANPGLFANISIPGLDTIANKVIYRAELDFMQVPDLQNPFENTYFPAPNLFLAAYNNDSMHRFLVPNDATSSNGSVINQYTFGCFPTKKTDPTSQTSVYTYSFDISRYVQGIITRHDPVYPLVLYAPSYDYVYLTPDAIYQTYTGLSAGPLNYPACGRVRVGGGNNTSYKMRLRIIYSDVK